MLKIDSYDIKVSNHTDGELFIKAVVKEDSVTLHIWDKKQDLDEGSEAR